jgi:hypothetical protein
MEQLAGRQRPTVNGKEGQRAKRKELRHMGNSFALSSLLFILED